MKTILAAALALAATGAGAQQMVFTSWGGTTQDAQAEAWAAPFTAKTGIAVIDPAPI